MQIFSAPSSLVLGLFLLSVSAVTAGLAAGGTHVQTLLGQEWEEKDFNHKEENQFSAHDSAFVCSPRVFVGEPESVHTARFLPAAAHLSAFPGDAAGSSSPARSWMCNEGACFHAPGYLDLILNETQSDMRAGNGRTHDSSKQSC